jgi:hypothetical protein
MAISGKHPLLKLIVVLVVISFAVLLWLGYALRNESESHGYHYQVSLSAESRLENVTLVLPVPFIDNSSPLGEALVRGEGYGIPPDWRLSLEYVNHTPMLKIDADTIIPEYHGYPLPLQVGQTPVETPPSVATAYSEETPILMPLQFGISQEAGRSIDTRDPIGREPPLSSPEMLIPAPCPDLPHTGDCYQYPVLVFVQYSSRGAGNITIAISGGGTNQWWVGGWTGNSYRDSILVTLENGEQGWVQAEGVLSTGEGRY